MEAVEHILLTGAGFTCNFGAPLAAEVWSLILTHPPLAAAPRVRELLLQDFDYESVYHTVFVGINGISGISVKFKYYLTEFFDQDFTEINNGVTTQPFDGFEVNPFHLAISFDLFKGKQFYYNTADD